MKRILLAAVVLAAALSAFPRGFEMGMSNAIRRKSRELDSKEVEHLLPTDLRKLFGVAAHGAPIIDAPVTVRDCAGRVMRTSTNFAGRFQLWQQGLSFPVMLEVPFAGGALHSIAYGAGSVDVHPLTDAVLRAYHRSALGVTDLDPRFTAAFGSLCPLPRKDAVESLQGVVVGDLSALLPRYGLDPSAFDLFTSTFEANHQGFDRAFDDLKIAVDPAGAAVSVTDSLTNAQVLSWTPPVSDASTPTAPGGLAVVSVSSASVQWHWTASASPNAIGYEFFRDGRLIAVTTTTSLLDRGLAPGSAHAVGVRSRALNGRAGAFSFGSATTLAALTVSKALSDGADGTIVDSSGVYSCGPGCPGLSIVLTTGSVVTFAGSAVSSSSFNGWSGPCAGPQAPPGSSLAFSGPCQVTLAGSQKVVARFSGPPPTYQSACPVFGGSPPSDADLAALVNGKTCVCEDAAICGLAYAVAGSTSGGTPPYAFQDDLDNPPPSGTHSLLNPFTSLGQLLGAPAVPPGASFFNGCIVDSRARSSCPVSEMLVGAPLEYAAVSDDNQGTGSVSIPSALTDPNHYFCLLYVSPNRKNADCYKKTGTALLSAAPDAASSFVRWEGCDAVVSVSASLGVCAMTTGGFKYVKAHFKKSGGGCAVAAAATGGGTVSGGGSAFVDGSTVNLTATALPNASFQSWSGTQSCSSDPSCQGTCCQVTCPASMSASFSAPAANPYDGQWSVQVHVAACSDVTSTLTVSVSAGAFGPASFVYCSDPLTGAAQAAPSGFCPSGLLFQKVTVSGAFSPAAPNLAGDEVLAGDACSGDNSFSAVAVSTATGARTTSFWGPLVFSKN